MEVHGSTASLHGCLRLRQGHLGHEKQSSWGSYAGQSTVKFPWSKNVTEGGLSADECQFWTLWPRHFHLLTYQPVKTMKTCFPSAVSYYWGESNKSTTVFFSFKLKCVRDNSIMNTQTTNYTWAFIHATSVPVLVVCVTIPKIKVSTWENKLQGLVWCSNCQQ